jgi:hypothetical protein
MQIKKILILFNTTFLIPRTRVSRTPFEGNLIPLNFYESQGKS